VKALVPSNPIAVLIGTAKVFAEASPLLQLRVPIVAV